MSEHLIHSLASPAENVLWIQQVQYHVKDHLMQLISGYIVNRNYCFLGPYRITLISGCGVPAP